MCFVFELFTISYECWAQPSVRQQNNNNDDNKWLLFVTTEQQNTKIRCFTSICVLILCSTSYSYSGVSFFKRHIYSVAIQATLCRIKGDNYVLNEHNKYM